MKNCLCLTNLLYLLFLFLFPASAHVPDNTWAYGTSDFRFEWNLAADKAKVTRGESTIWNGSLLPAFWLVSGNKKIYTKSSVIPNGTLISDDSLSLRLKLDNYGTGVLSVRREQWGIRFVQLRIQWNDVAPAIVEMYFGTSPVHPDSNVVQPNWDKPFMPDWQCFGFCVPGAKGGTVQSFFRMWDFGQASIALGGFGPALGSPYGAAYPRPLYYLGMGADAGFAAVGAGSIPDAPMFLQVRATSACIQYIYREDLWGASKDMQRTWDEPLRITLDSNAYAAFRRYYNSFPSKENSPAAVPAVWNTWGDWREKKYAIAPITHFAKSLGSNILVLDDPWESSQGSGTPSADRFPHFSDDLADIRKNGLKIGLWETVGWISRPADVGLTDEDLLVQQNGKPCRANWNMSPWSDGYFCLDISSARTKEFIRKRTINIMKTQRPALLKLDFGYGFPDPSVAVARNPAYRGERFAYELVKLISETAKSIDPSVIIMYYSISPLWFPVIDLISLDDQGDLWYDIPAGHQQWSIWSSLAGEKNMALSGSSGYDWVTDDEVLLNTAIIGASGAVLPSSTGNANISSTFLNRRLAINRWYRKTTLWQPLWLNSQQGNLQSPPLLKCFGRVETVSHDSILTALALRAPPQPGAQPAKSALSGFYWNGRWALIAQDNADIRRSAKLAVIPFDAGSIVLPYPVRPSGVTVLSMEGEFPFKRWQWNNGHLELTISPDQLSRTAGFLVTR